MSPCNLGGVTALLLHLQPHTCRVLHLTVIKYLLGFSVQAWTGLGTEGPQATTLSRHAGNTHRDSRQTGVWATGALYTANIRGWQGLGKVAAHCSLGCVLGGDQEGGYRTCQERACQAPGAPGQSQGLWALGVLWALLPQAPGYCNIKAKVKSPLPLISENLNHEALYSNISPNLQLIIGGG